MGTTHLLCLRKTTRDGGTGNLWPSGNDNIWWDTDYNTNHRFSLLKNKNNVSDPEVCCVYLYLYHFSICILYLVETSNPVTWLTYCVGSVWEVSQQPQAAVYLRADSQTRYKSKVSSVSFTKAQPALLVFCYSAVQQPLLESKFRHGPEFALNWVKKEVTYLSWCGEQLWQSLLWDWESDALSAEAESQEKTLIKTRIWNKTGSFCKFLKCTSICIDGKVKNVKNSNSLVTI